MAEIIIDYNECNLNFRTYHSKVGDIPLCRIETTKTFKVDDIVTFKNFDKFALPWTTTVDGQSGYYCMATAIYNALSGETIKYLTKLDDDYFILEMQGGEAVMKFKNSNTVTANYYYQHAIDIYFSYGASRALPVPCWIAFYSTTDKKYFMGNAAGLDNTEFKNLAGLFYFIPHEMGSYGYDIVTYGKATTPNSFGSYILKPNAQTGGNFNPFFGSVRHVKYDPNLNAQLQKLFNDSDSPRDNDDPNPGDGDSHGGGGGGTDDLGGDPIKDTGVPTIEATDSGLMTLYNPTVSELQALGRFLWSDGLDLNSFKKLFNDPFDTLLGLSIIPIVPPTSGTKKIMFGNLDSGVSAKVISHQFVPNVDMGSVTLGEVYNGALDYSPFTTVSIYLPFIGYRELNVQDVMNSKIHLVYKFDVLTGGCIAELYVDHLKTGNKSKDNSKFKWESHSGLLASFEGQCAVNIPLASQDYTNTIRAMIGAVGMVGGAAASFATGNPALGVAALAVGSANSAMQASTPTVQRSGHLSSSNAIMANLTPFLTVTRPHQCKPSKYYKLRGVPSQIYVSKLSSLTTSKHDYYLQVAEIPDIKVAGATDTEIAEIKNLLKEGVVL